MPVSDLLPDHPRETAVRAGLIGLKLVLLGMFCLVTGAAMAESNPIFAVRLAHLHDSCEGTAPVTFGEPFRPGDVPQGWTVAVKDGDKVLPTQVDAKARNPDGSLRHAVITVNAPCSIDRDKELAVAATDDQPQTSDSIGLTDVLNSGFNDQIVFQAGGQTWKSDARNLLQQVAKSGGCASADIYCRHWLNGPLAGEWVVGAPPTNSNGKRHPQLMVFFAVRAYGPAPVDTVRVDTTVENDWAYAPNPHNLEYSATLSMPGHKPVSIDKLTHYRQGRWHKVLWWGANQSTPWFAALNSRYMQATPAVPSYERIKLSDKMLSKVRQGCAPMNHCNVNRHMGSTGAQSQIGPLPQWSSAYIVNAHDYRAYRWMLANSDALGAYRAHYRTRDTGNPVSVRAHPCATLVWAAETKRCAKAPHADDRFPHCKHDCKTPLEAEPSHHGAPAYVAYMVTGDWYYEQELTFWADWTVFYQNPKYRGYRAGLLHIQQVRAQAWSLRTLGFGSYLLPDESPFKKYLNQVVANNIAWYNDHYANNPDANKLGFIESHYGVNYPSTGPHKRTGVSPWQLSFFNWATGNLVDLGFDGAARMRDYFSRFSLGLTTSSKFCPEMASAYYVRVRDKRGSAFYTSFAQVYDSTFPHLTGIGCSSKRFKQAVSETTRYKASRYPAGTMVGYPTSDTGFVANFQIGLAAAANSSHHGARGAWRWFMNRPVRPDYQHAPQFAVVPTNFNDSGE